VQALAQAQALAQEPPPWGPEPGPVQVWPGPVQEPPLWEREQGPAREPLPWAERAVRARAWEQEPLRRAYAPEPARARASQAGPAEQPEPLAEPEQGKQVWAVPPEAEQLEPLKRRTPGRVEGLAREQQV